MKTVEIKGNLRENLGKPGSKQLRKEEKVPCVLYGTDAPVHFSAELNSFKKLVYSPDAYIAKLDIDGTSYEAIIQDAQFHPVSDKLIHADFLVATKDKPVTMRIPVATTGVAIGVMNGGRLVLSIRAVRLKGLYTALPEVISIDITKLNIGQAVKIGELDLPEGVETVADDSAVVVTVKTTRVAVTVDAGDDEVAEGEEGAEAAAEEKAEA